MLFANFPKCLHCEYQRRPKTYPLMAVIISICHWLRLGTLENYSIIVSGDKIIMVTVVLKIWGVCLSKMMLSS